MKGSPRIVLRGNPKCEQPEVEESEFGLATRFLGSGEIRQAFMVLPKAKGSEFDQKSDKLSFVIKIQFLVADTRMVEPHDVAYDVTLLREPE